MKKIYTLTSRKVKDFYNFYVNGKNVTNEWMWFFSGLSSEQEKNCTKLFLNYYRRKH